MRNEQFEIASMGLINGLIPVVIILQKRKYRNENQFTQYFLRVLYLLDLEQYIVSCCRLLGGSRIRVTHARPRTRGLGRRFFNPNMRCYECGMSGHFYRDCPELYDRSYKDRFVYYFNFGIILSSILIELRKTINLFEIKHFVEFFPP